MELTRMNVQSDQPVTRAGGKDVAAQPANPIVNVEPGDHIRIFLTGLVHGAIFQDDVSRTIAEKSEQIVEALKFHKGMGGVSLIFQVVKHLVGTAGNKAPGLVAVRTTVNGMMSSFTNLQVYRAQVDEVLEFVEEHRDHPPLKELSMLFLELFLERWYVKERLLRDMASAGMQKTSEQIVAELQSARLVTTLARPKPVDAAAIYLADEHLKFPRPIPTGYKPYDLMTRTSEQCTGGRIPGNVVGLLAPTGAGKALCLETRINTPAGPRRFGDLKVGDYVFGSSGKPTQVTFVTEVMYGREAFDVEFRNGQVIRACADHIWTVEDGERRKKPREGSTKTKAYATCVRDMTTKDLTKVKLRIGSAGPRFRIPVAGAVEYPPQRPTVPPYLLGVWLGDGTSSECIVTKSSEDCAHITHRLGGTGYALRATGLDRDLRHRAERDGHGITPELRALGVLDNKHIPTSYLRGSAEDRLELLRGLMDTDGSTDHSVAGKHEFSTSIPALADQFEELLNSFSIYHTRTVKSTWYTADDGSRAACQDSHRFYISTRQSIFTLPRKISKHVPKTADTSAYHQIVKITPVDSVPMMCIQVDAPDHLYLVGERNIPTHNTTTCINMMGRSAIDGGQRSVLFHYEQNVAQSLYPRIISALTGVPTSNLVGRPAAEWPKPARDMLDRLHELEKSGHFVVYDMRDPALSSSGVNGLMSILNDMADKYGAFPDQVAIDWLLLMVRAWKTSRVFKTDNELYGTVMQDILRMTQHTNCSTLVCHQMTSSVGEEGIDHPMSANSAQAYKAFPDLCSCVIGHSLPDGNGIQRIQSLKNRGEPGAIFAKIVRSCGQILPLQGSYAPKRNQDTRKLEWQPTSIEQD